MSLELKLHHQRGPALLGFSLFYQTKQDGQNMKGLFALLVFHIFAKLMSNRKPEKM